LIDAKILKLRQGYGAKLQAAKGVEGGVGLLRGLAKGFSVALMNDQKYNEGVAAPLFGHDAMTADGPTRLAQRFGAPLIPFSLARLSPEGGKAVRYRIVIHDPLDIPKDMAQDAAIKDTVIRINQFVETHVRAHPEQWFWVHKRWGKETWKAAGVA
jgi:KDO2-lipid IV(A) lauroyltransferase